MPSGLGLRELVARSKPNECPLCGDPRKPQVTKPSLLCGDPVCRAAYSRYYYRDRRNKKKALDTENESVTVSAEREASMYTDYDNVKAYDRWCNASCGCADCRGYEEEERDLSTHDFYIDTDVEVARIDGGLGAIYDAETDETVGWYRLNWNRYDKCADAVITLVSSRTSRAERDSKWLKKLQAAVLEKYPMARVRYWL